MKNMAERCEIVVKKWVFRGKKGVIGLEKIRGGDQSRKAKWCKMQVLFLKTDKTKDVKSQKYWFFYLLLDLYFL